MRKIRTYFIASTILCLSTTGAIPVAKAEGPETIPFGAVQITGLTTIMVDNLARDVVNEGSSITVTVRLDENGIRRANDVLIVPFTIEETLAEGATPYQQFVELNHVRDGQYDVMIFPGENSASLTIPTTNTSTYYADAKLRIKFGKDNVFTGGGYNVDWDNSPADIVYQFHIRDSQPPPTPEVEVDHNKVVDSVMVNGVAVSSGTTQTVTEGENIEFKVMLKEAATERVTIPVRVCELFRKDHPSFRWDVDDHYPNCTGIFPSQYSISDSHMPSLSNGGIYYVHIEPNQTLGSLNFQTRDNKHTLYDTVFIFRTAASSTDSLLATTNVDWDSGNSSLLNLRSEKIVRIHDSKRTVNPVVGFCADPHGNVNKNRVEEGSDLRVNICISHPVSTMERNFNITAIVPSVAGSAATDTQATVQDADITDIRHTDRTKVVNFAKNDPIRKTLTIPTVDDRFMERPETFKVVLSTDTPDLAEIQNDTKPFTIIDNDSYADSLRVMDSRGSGGDRRYGIGSTIQIEVQFEGSKQGAGIAGNQVLKFNIEPTGSNDHHYVVPKSRITRTVTDGVETLTVSAGPRWATATITPTGETYAEFVVMDDEAFVGNRAIRFRASLDGKLKNRLARFYAEGRISFVAGGDLTANVLVRGREVAPHDGQRRVGVHVDRTSMEEGSTVPFYVSRNWTGKEYTARFTIEHHIGGVRGANCNDRSGVLCKKQGGLPTGIDIPYAVRFGTQETEKAVNIRTHDNRAPFSKGQHVTLKLELPPTQTPSVKLGTRSVRVEIEDNDAQPEPPGGYRAELLKVAKDCTTDDPNAQVDENGDKPQIPCGPGPTRHRWKESVYAYLYLNAEPSYVSYSEFLFDGASFQEVTAPSIGRYQIPAVTNGHIRAVERMDKGNRVWKLTLRAIDAEKPMTLSVGPKDDDCPTQHSEQAQICFGDRKLSNTQTLTWGRLQYFTVDIPDRVLESGGKIPVTMRSEVTVPVDTWFDVYLQYFRDNEWAETIPTSELPAGTTAANFRDFGGKHGEAPYLRRISFRIEQGSSSGGATVTVLDDEVDEGNEAVRVFVTFRDNEHWLSGHPVYKYDEITREGIIRNARDNHNVIIENSDPLPREWLARFGRTVGYQLVDSLTARLDTGSDHMTVAGVRIGEAVAGREQGMSVEEALRSISFHLSGGDSLAGKAKVTAWGSVAHSSFSGKSDGARVRGDVTSNIVGFDTTWQRFLAGVMVAHSRGEGPWSGQTDGEINSDLIGVYPYMQANTDSLSGWVMAGAAHGSMEITPSGRAMRKGEVELQVAAAGAAATIPVQELVDLTLKSDAMWVGIESGRAGDVVPTEADASRIRAQLEASRTFDLAQSTITPSLGLGVRHEEGDAETGTGIEFLGGIAVEYERWRVKGKAHVLVIHQESNYREHGIGLNVAYAAQDNGEGMSFSLAPQYGPVKDGPDLWSNKRHFGNSDLEAQMAATVFYGIRSQEFPGLVTPKAGVMLGQMDTYTLGVGWMMAAGADVNLETSRREREHAGMLRISFRW